MRNNRNKYVTVPNLTNRSVLAGEGYFRAADGVIRRLTEKQRTKKSRRGIVRDWKREALNYQASNKFSTI